MRAPTPAPSSGHPAQKNTNTLAHGPLRLRHGLRIRSGHSTIPTSPRRTTGRHSTIPTSPPRRTSGHSTIPTSPPRATVRVLHRFHAGKAARGMGSATPPVRPGGDAAQTGAGSISASNWSRSARAKAAPCKSTPASMFRSCAASVRLADVTKARSSSTTMHVAWRHALSSASPWSERGSKYSSGRLGHGQSSAQKQRPKAATTSASVAPRARLAEPSSDAPRGHRPQGSRRSQRRRRQRRLLGAMARRP
jgi:hypothetical protein